METIKKLFHLIKAVLHFILSFAVFSLVVGILFPSQLENRNFLYKLFIVCWFGYHLLCLRKPKIWNILKHWSRGFHILKALWEDKTPPKEKKQAENDTTPTAEKQKETPQEHKPYNIAAWYGIIARSILTDCITELNVRQIKTVCLMETGDLVYGENNEKAGKIESIPPKDYWIEIVRQLEEDGLSAMMEKDGIQISWE